MSLNEATLAEFEETSGLTAPGTTPATATSNEVVVEATTTVNEADNEKLKEIQLEDIGLKTTKDAVDEYDKLLDVSKNILAAESISRNDISQLLASLDDEELALQFNEKVGSIHGFTTLSTKTQLQETKRFFSRTLEDKKHNLDLTIGDVIARGRAKATEHTQLLINDIDAIQARVQGICVMASTALNAARESKNALFYRAVQLENRKEDQATGRQPIEKTLYDIRICSLVHYPMDGEAAAAFGGLFNFARDYRDEASQLDKFIKAYCMARRFDNKPSNIAHVLRLSPLNEEDRRYDQQVGDSYSDFLGFLASQVLVVCLDNLRLTAEEALICLSSEQSISISELSSYTENLVRSEMFVTRLDGFSRISAAMMDAFTAVLSQ